VGNISNLWGREPSMIVALVQAALVMGVSFGLNLTPDQIAGILAVSAVVLGLVTRSQVTPPANLAEVAANIEAVDGPLAAPYIPGEQNDK